ncbi:hypothetical protein [Enterocloster bolteae]|uniref:hypothetical protein n=1 Tax=Enterocloster bolteae TaxID=208479 RepID=UPI00210D5F74|nr:hypothetical protein [Enterocloster bolteae]MCQ5143397.1 hypothetical protein [Enterocloster bolteae]
MEIKSIEKDMMFMKALKEQLDSEGVKVIVLEAPFYNYGISVILDFSKRDREKDKQFSEMQAHIDCLKAELQETQFYSDKLKQELEMKDGTKMFDTLMENSSGEARELLSRHLYENLCCVELNQAKGLILPSEPIDVASMLIKATRTVRTNSIQKAFNPNMSDEYEIDKYSKSDLQQIAEHLLAYCNNNADGD